MNTRRHLQSSLSRPWARFAFVARAACSLLWWHAPATAQQESPEAAPASHPAVDSRTSSELSFDLESALVSRDHGLSADDAARRAKERAPQIASAQASARSAAWDAETQSARFLPTVSLTAQYRRVSLVKNDAFKTVGTELGALFPPGTTLPELPSFTQPRDNYALVASARWPVSDLFFRVWPAYKAARGIAEVRKLEVETRSANTELLAREAFYAHARALATLLVAEQALKQAAAQTLQAKQFVEAGSVAPADLMTATARLEAVHAATARSRGAVAVTRNTLAVLMAIPAGDVDGIREPVTALPEPPAAGVDALLERGLAQRPELRALQALVHANEQLERAEWGATLPVLSVEGSVLEANPNPRYIPPLAELRHSWEVGATLAWTANNALVGYRRTQRAGAEIDKARADLAALEDGVRIEVVQSFEDYKAADAAARASDAQQQAAEETYRVRLARYRAGAGVQIDLLASDLALTQARLDHLNAALDARVALARVARACSCSLP